MKNAGRRALCLSLIACAALAQASPVLVFDLRRLITGADIIALGTIQDIHDDTGLAIDVPSGRPRLMFADMTVDQILKGPSPALTIRFRFVAPDRMVGYRGVFRGGYGVIFLTQRGDEYTLAPPYHPLVVTVAGDPIQAANSEDRVVMAIARALRSPTLPSPLKMEAIFTLWGIDSRAARAGMRTGLEDPDMKVRLTAAAALLAVKDLSGLALVEPVLQQPAADIDPQLLAKLLVGIRDLSDAAAIPALTRLLNSASVETRRVACTALGQIESEAAIRALASALDDSDFDVRVNAVQGLSALTGQPQLAPSWEAFEANEWQFVAPLKAWVASHIDNR